MEPPQRQPHSQQRQRAQDLLVGRRLAVDPQPDQRVHQARARFGPDLLYGGVQVGAHHLLLMALADSFHLLPIGASWSFHGWAALSDAVAAMFVTGLRLMAPVLILLLFVYVALVLLARAVPQIQVLCVSAPLTVALGLIVFALSLPAFVAVLQQSYGHLGALLPDFLRAMAGT